MKNITLKQLRYFEALARHGHFGRAADASAISQPALSVQIKDLETSLGVALFERSSKQVRLTGFGEMFADRVRSILQSVDELGELALAAQDGLVGRLRLGIIPTIAPYLLPRVISTLAATHDGLDLQVRETVTPTLIEELSDGRIDCAIVALPVSEPSLTETPLFSEEIMLVRPDHQAEAPVPDAEALRAQRLLLLEEGHCFRDQALSFCGLSGDAPRQGLDGSSLSTLVQMVGAGIGVTLIPEMAVPVETRSAAVAVSRFPKSAPSRQVGMIWRNSSPLAPKMRELAELIKTCS